MAGHDGKTGPIRVKQIVNYLNKRGYRTSTGGPFYTGTVHDILTRPAYSGVHYFNITCSRTRKQKPREEWVPFETPVIIPPGTFAAVQQRLEARSPKKIAPRVVSSPVLLAGLARCHHCNGNLMLTTGKSGRYRYYSCAAKVLKGSCGCGRPVRIPEGKLDALVTEALIERLFTQDRLKALQEHCGAYSSLSFSRLCVPQEHYQCSSGTLCSVFSRFHSAGNRGSPAAFLKATA